MLTHHQQFASEKLINFQEQFFFSQTRETDILSYLRVPVAIIQDYIAGLYLICILFKHRAFPPQ